MNLEPKYTLWHLADIAILRGEYDLAKKYYQEANDYSSKSGNQAQENIYIHVHDGWLALITGELEKSRQTYEALSRLSKKCNGMSLPGLQWGDMDWCYSIQDKSKRRATILRRAIA
ncbi:MAG: hypothetical protein IPN96_12065 [Anaerolineales bacterium]|nr:hypothetical protein [Anaerolineales bacterium]